MINRDVLFATIKPLFGGKFTQVQVDIINAILDSELSDNHMAYVLATGFGEAKLTPVRENMNYSAAQIKKVWPKRPEAVQFARNPQGLANSVYGGRMGNRVGTNDGWNYRGGGIDQCTGRDNYRKIGIENDPEAILKPSIAVASILHGMKTGRYRGFKLSDFDTANGGYNFVSARGIINDDVARNGKKYAEYAEYFLKAIKAGRAAYVPDADTSSVKVTSGDWFTVILKLLGSIKWKK